MLAHQVVEKTVGGKTITMGSMLVRMDFYSRTSNLNLIIPSSKKQSVRVWKSVYALGTSS